MAQTPSNCTGYFLTKLANVSICFVWFKIDGQSGCRLPVPRPGQVLGLVGTNGIGKSTALKVLAGKLKPNLGRFNVTFLIAFYASLCCVISSTDSWIFSEPSRLAGDIDLLSRI